MSVRSYSTASRSSGSAPSAASTPSVRRTQAVPNRAGDKALYTVITQPPGNRAPTTETRVLDLRTGTSAIFSNEAGNREVQWLGVDDDVVWLRDADYGATEIWIADASGQRQESHCAGQITSCASLLKTKRLRNEYEDIAIAVACPSDANGNLQNLLLEFDRSQDNATRNAIWYTTLKLKETDNEEGTQTRYRYIVTPTNWINALRGTGLECPLPFPYGSPNDFDISSSGIVFLSKDANGGSVYFPTINAHYIPLKTFTELSRPRPQVIDVKDHEGRSSLPIFSPDGGSVAFLKKKHPIDQNDRNRLIFINHIRDFKVHMYMAETPTRISNKEWHLSPFSIAWADNGKELYAVAVHQGIRRLFKIPVALSSTQDEPEPITNESRTPADLQHLRMVFSAPMNTRP